MSKPDLILIGAGGHTRAYLGVKKLSSALKQRINNLWVL
jgi:hypothetical protein